MDDNKRKTESQRYNHSNFDFFFNKVAWAAITAVVSFAAFQLNKLSESVADLNKNMTLVVYQLQGVEKENEEFKKQLLALIERVENLEKSNGSRPIRIRN